MFRQGFDAHEERSNDKGIMNQPLPSDRAACPRINAERQLPENLTRILPLNRFVRVVQLNILH